MAQWLFPLLVAGGFLIALFFIAWRNTKRQITRTQNRRPNLVHEAFLEAMSQEVSQEASQFLWEKLMADLSFHNTTLTPDPDDDLARDLPVDHEEWSLDWPREWTQGRGIDEDALPNWPGNWPTTVRNYGRWLDTAPA